MKFGLEDILEYPIQDEKLKCYYIGYDLGECRLDAFTEVLMDAILDFAFGYHTGILKQYDRRKLKEAAKSIYGIKSYQDVKWTYIDDDSEIEDSDEAGISKEGKKIIKRGEFGELILHTILRDYFGTIPMLSKIYFKDTDGATVHGFDSVHIGKDLYDVSKMSLFLGESKIYHRKDYTAGECGVNDLIEDVRSHLNKDFLNRECAIISKKQNSFIDAESYNDKNTKEEYESFLQIKDEWYNFLVEVTRGTRKLEDLLNSVTMPLICTYQSSIFKDGKTNTQDNFAEEYELEAKYLYGKFENKLSKVLGELHTPDRLNILLILLPIPSKKDLIKALHQKLYNQQNA